MGSTAVARKEAGTSRLCHGRTTAADVSFAVPCHLEPGAAAAVSSSALPLVQLWG